MFAPVAYVFDGAEYCDGCLPCDSEHADVTPIWPGDSQDYVAYCHGCHAALDVTLTATGMLEARRQYVAARLDDALYHRRDASHAGTLLDILASHGLDTTALDRLATMAIEHAMRLHVGFGE